MNNEQYEKLIHSKQGKATPTPIGEMAMKIVSRLAAQRTADKQAAQIVASVLPAGLYPRRVHVVGDRVIVEAETWADREKLRTRIPALYRAVQIGKIGAQSVSIVFDERERGNENV